jgi:hypothetical protein
MPSSKPFRVGRSRTGLGLFATAPIKKGAFIIEYKGRKVDNKTADELDNKYLFEINSRWTIDGSSRRNTARYVNHSCRPNAESDVIKHKVIIRAIRNIEPGTEITYDYGKDYYTTFLAPIGCRCPKCTEKRKRERAEARAAAKRRKARKLRAEAKAQAKTKASTAKAPAKTARKTNGAAARAKSANGRSASGQSASGHIANGSKRSANGHASTRTARGRAASGGAMARRNVAAASRERTLSL